MHANYLNPINTKQISALMSFWIACGLKSAIILTPAILRCKYVEEQFHLHSHCHIEYIQRACSGQFLMCVLVYGTFGAWKLLKFMQRTSPKIQSTNIHRLTYKSTHTCWFCLFVCQLPISLSISLPCKSLSPTAAPTSAPTSAPTATPTLSYSECYSLSR